MLSDSDIPEEKPNEEVSSLAEAMGKFTYAKINQATGEDDAVTHLSFEAFPNNLSNRFVSLYKDRRKEGLERDDGLKLHISLANIEDNIEKGWNIVVKHMIKNNVINCKVIRDKYRNEMMTDPSQCGKEITVYIYKNIEKKIDEWEKIIQEITQDLAENKIIPGPKPDSDNPINGSNYISYRGYIASAPVKSSKLELDASDEDDILEESSQKDNSPVEDILLTEINTRLIAKALNRLHNPVGNKSDSSDSLPPSPVPDLNSSDSETKSDSTKSENSDIEIYLPFKKTKINVTNQLKIISFGELQALHNKIDITIHEKSPNDSQNKSNKNQSRSLLSRATSISNFHSFHSSSNTGRPKEMNIEDDQTKKYTKQ